MGLTGTDGEPIPLRRSRRSEAPEQAAENIGEGPLTPEEVALAYIRQHGGFSDPDSATRWPRRVKITALIAAVVVVLAGATFGVERSGVLHRSTQPPKSSQSPKPPLVKVIQNLPGHEVTFNIRLDSFYVKVVAYSGPTSVTQGSNAISLSQQGDDQVFTVTHNLTIVTANPSARVALYDKFKLIGFYFPTTGPFTLIFHALSKK